MKFYKDIANKPYAYEDNVDSVHIRDGLIEVTESEFKTLVDSLLTQEQIIAHFKSLYLGIFNNKLKELDYDSIATVQLWMDDATFGTEATRIMTWYKALITKNYAILNEAKISGVIPTDEEYLAQIATVVF